MKSLSEIKDLLYNASRSRGLSGVSLDLAVDLLAQNIYYNQVNNAAVIASNNLDSTRSVNVLIKYALDNLYPIYRGRNSIVEFDMTIMSPSINLKAGDSVFSFKNYSLFLLEDISYDRDTQLVNWGNQDQTKITRKVRCVVATEYKKQVKFNDPASFYVDSTGKGAIIDASEDVIITKHDGVSNSYRNIPWTKFLSEHTDRLFVNYDDVNSVNPIGTESLPLLLTSYDYGLRLFPAELVNSRMGNKQYTKVDRSKRSKNTYYASYPVYTEIIPEKSHFRTLAIPGLVLNEGADSIKITPFVPREAIDDGIQYKVKVNLVQFQRIRANLDLINTFNTYFKDKVVNSEVYRSSDSVVIYVIPREGHSITATDFNSFKARFLYHINANVSYVVCTVKQVNIGIITQSDVLIDDSLINAAVKKFDNISGRKISYEEVLAELSKIPGITYARITNGTDNPRIGLQGDPATLANISRTEYSKMNVISIKQNVTSNN